MKQISIYINEAFNKQEQPKYLTILDKAVNGDVQAIEDFTKLIRPNGPTIYAFVTDKLRDIIKIGYTDQHPEKRIDQWREYYGKKPGEVTCIGYWSSEEFNKAGERVFFWDHAVHKRVVGRGYENIKKDNFLELLTDKGKEIIDLHYSSEFFRKYKRLLNGELSTEKTEELSSELIQDIISEMKQNIIDGTEDFKTYTFNDEGNTTSRQASQVWGSPDTYSNTGLQNEAIENGVKAIKEGKTKLLMAAVMRFGKTHTCYEIIKKAGLKRIIVTSGKADVRKAWKDDINHKHFINDFVFIEIIDKYNWDISYKADDADTIKTIHGAANIELLDALENQGKVLIFFATLSDLGGSVKAMKAKHIGVFDRDFDMMVIDETHYGSHGATWGAATKLNDDFEDIQDELDEMDKDAETLKSLNIPYKISLQVSGTPYYILASNEFIEEDTEIISKVSYTDMLKARDAWEKDNPNKDRSDSPYFGIPTLHKVGLQLTSECQKILKENNFTESMSVLLEVKNNKFVHETAIRNLMKGLFGDGSSDTLSFLNNKKIEGNKVCKHTIIRLPMIKTCEVMKRLLSEIIDTNERQIINVVGNHADVSSINQLNNILNELDNKGKRSIILTVNRYLTGVSMPLIDSMIYMKNARSPQDYDQAIFRLCTRNVKKVNAPERGMQKRINMKENVYLIDFNISDMFVMMTNSARMKANAEKNPSSKRVKEILEEELSVMPIYCEQGDEVITKMKELTSKDLMMVYSNYNNNKSIEEIVNDDINKFLGLFYNKNFQGIINGFDIEGDKSKNTIDSGNEGSDEITIKTIPVDLAKRLKAELKKMTPEEKNNFKETQEKFKRIMKLLLYCNLCIDEPYMDIETIINDTNSEIHKMLRSFKIYISDLKKLYKSMSVSYQQLFNSILTKIAILSDDTSKGDYEKFMKGIAGLGRIEKNEVITPESIVKKIVSKLDDSVYENAESILLVNEKQGEFFTHLCKKFGKEKMAKKCKIVASSEMTVYLMKKLLKSMGLNDYINNVILDINDNNDDGKYIVNDFLEIDNNEILNMNNGKKFDVVLMNPPYGSTGGDTLHLRFVDKCLDIANHQITVMPFTFVTKVDHKPSKKYKEKFSPYLSEVEEVDSKYFKDTAMPNVGIYVFGDETQNIDIKYVNSPNETLSSLLDKSEFTNYEKEFIQYLGKQDSQQIIGDCGRLNSWKNIVNNAVDYQLALSELVEKSIKKTKQHFEIENVILLVNRSNGGMNGTAISSKNGQIFDNYIDLKNFFIENPLGIGYNGLMFKSKKAAQNCKIALQNPLLRFTLYKLQDDQNMVTRVYKYIPAINWEDPRVKTDEGLLEVCGCSKDKCKEYSDYCRKVIEEVDKK